VSYVNAVLAANGGDVETDYQKQSDNAQAIKCAVHGDSVTLPVPRLKQAAGFEPRLPSGNHFDRLIHIGPDKRRYRNMGIRPVRSQKPHSEKATSQDLAPCQKMTESTCCLFDLVSKIGHHARSITIKLVWNEFYER
jgi:hypothetical protein